MSKVGSQEDKDQALSDLASVERRASAALIGKIPRVNDAPLNETDLPTNKEVLRIVQILLEVVLSLLMPRIRLDGCVRVTADDDVFALGLTSLDVPRLKFVVKQRLNRYIETEQIFLNPTVNRMAVFLIKPPEENGADLNLPELVDAGLVKDKALPHWAVWILTLICSFGFHGLSMCFMIFLVLLQFVFLHECGKCSSRGSIGRVDHMLQTHCEDPDLFFAFLAVVVGFPIVMVITITITLLMVVLVKWVVVGKYK